MLISIVPKEFEHTVKEYLREEYKDKSAADLIKEANELAQAIVRGRGGVTIPEEN